MGVVVVGYPGGHSRGTHLVALVPGVTLESWQPHRALQGKGERVGGHLSLAQPSPVPNSAQPSPTLALSPSHTHQGPWWPRLPWCTQQALLALGETQCWCGGGE